MPLDSLDEDGLPKNPDLQLMQWRFMLTVDETLGVNKDETWDNLLQAIKENGDNLTHGCRLYSFDRILLPSLPPSLLPLTRYDFIL